MELTLMCEDQEVLDFDLDLAGRRVIDVRPGEGAVLAPMGVQLDGPDPTEDLTRLVNRRAISTRRVDLESILTATGTANVVELALRSRGLSLSDPYWYRTPGDDATWSDINFFDNAWDPSFGRAVLMGDWKALAHASCMVPDLTCGGSAQKGWLLEKCGPRLVKGSLGTLGVDPLGEVAATRLASRILAEGEFVPYELREWEGCIFSAAPPMVSAGEELVIIRALDRAVLSKVQSDRDAPGGDEGIARYAQALDALGVPDARIAATKLEVCLTLSLTLDAHWGNYGIIRDVHTGALRAAPIFDLGGSFGTVANKAVMEIILANQLYTECFLIVRFRYLDEHGDYSWYDPSSLEGFDEELKDILLTGGHLSTPYVELVTRLHQRQRSYVNEIAAASKG